MNLRARLDAALYRLKELVRAASKARGICVDIHGPEKHSGTVLTLRYIGSGHGLNYWIDQIFGEPCKELARSHIPLWHLGRAAENPPSGTDLLLCDLPWPYYHLHRGVFWRMPGWILQKTRLAPVWEDVVAGFRKNTRSTDLRKVRKYGLSYRITSDPEQLALFHDTLFEPYTRQRFGHLINGDTREDIIHFGVHEGVLLQVMCGDDWVAGVVLSHWQDEMHFLWLGLPDGLERGLADAALSGIYLFSLQYAHAQGCADMDFSLTRPLISNGIYHYKRKWGARLIDDWPQAEFHWQFLTLSPAVRSFLAEHPMILREQGNLVAYHWAEGHTTPDTLLRLGEQGYSEGLAVYRMLLPEGLNTGEPGQPLPDWLRLHLLSETSSPLQRLHAPFRDD
ncbi:MAG: hypothetical protein IPM37_08710 [Hahellaceae bacterium]|nr:hypothetical protein [Hahellaceae bacterium]